MKAEVLRGDLRRLVDEDAAAFDAVSAAYQLPKSTDAERLARTNAIDAALLGAARVPCEVARRAAEVAGIALRAAEAGNKNAASDAAVAAALALAAAKGATHNVEINVAGLSRPETAGDLLDEAQGYVKQAEDFARLAETNALKRIRPAQ